MSDSLIPQVFDKLKCTTPYGTAEQPAENPRKALLNSLLNSLLTTLLTTPYGTADTLLPEEGKTGAVSTTGARTFQDGTNGRPAKKRLFFFADFLRRLMDCISCGGSGKDPEEA